MSSTSSFEFQTAKSFARSEDDRVVHAGKRFIASANVRMDRMVVKFGPATTDGTIKAKRSESRPSLLLNTQAKKQTKIVSKVKSAKDSITKLFKTTDRVSPSLTPTPQRSVSEVGDVIVAGSLPSGKTGLADAASLDDDFICVSQCATEVPSPSPSAPPFTLPEPRYIAPPTVIFNELPTIEEEAEGTELDIEVLQAKPSCGLLTTSNSEAKYDAMLTAEFAAFTFDSKDIQEWSDEVEREKQARMNAHFTYASEALAVPVPRLSTYFATDGLADSAMIERDEFINDPSAAGTEISETSTSSADSSLVTSVDTEEDRLQLSPVILRRLGNVQSHQDLKVTMNCSGSFSNLSCWSFDLDRLDSTAVASKIGLRRSVKCNNLRKSFSLLESGIHHTLNRERRASNDQPSSIHRLGGY